MPRSQSMTTAMRVAVVMGSPADRPALEPAIRTLEEFGVDVEVRIVSAHKTPWDALEFASGAAEAGFSAIIAGAGGAAHLPGMLASVTSLPVVGVPIAITKLQGFDSLLSMIQTPPGTPVATVAIESGVNAALLALRILSVGSPDLAAALDEHRQGMAAEVRGHANSDESVAEERRPLQHNREEHQ